MVSKNGMKNKQIPINVFIVILMLFIGFKIFGAPWMAGKSSSFEMVGYSKIKNSLHVNVRVLSFYTSEVDPAKIMQHAKAQSYTEGGTTTVFYFNSKENTPDVTFVKENFDKKYEPYCIAAYWKYPNGNESFKENPFQ